MMQATAASKKPGAQVCFNSSEVVSSQPLNRVPEPGARQKAPLPMYARENTLHVPHTVDNCETFIATAWIAVASRWKLLLLLTTKPLEVQGLFALSSRYLAWYMLRPYVRAPDSLVHPAEWAGGEQWDRNALCWFWGGNVVAH